MLKSNVGGPSHKPYSKSSNPKARKSEDPCIPESSDRPKKSVFTLKKFAKLPPNMGDAAKATSRPMKYPYTFSAKIAQFPMKFHVQNAWLFKYYFIAVACCIPIFYKIGKLSYAPENVRKWEEIRRRDFTPRDFTKDAPHH